MGLVPPMGSRKELIRRHKAEKLCADVAAKIERLTRELTDAKKGLAQASIEAELSPDAEAACHAATALVERLKAALTRATLARPAAFLKKIPIFFIKC